MKSAFGCSGRERKSAGAAADWVPCWWKGKNERFNSTDLCVKMKKRTRQANIKWKPACLTDCNVSSAELLPDLLANKLSE